MKCKVCGTNFELKVDNHYITRDEVVIRTGISSIVGSNNEIESKLYDTFDCPVCGCQNVMQERKRIAISRLYHADGVVIASNDNEEITTESWCEEPTCDNLTEDKCDRDCEGCLLQYSCGKAETIKESKEEVAKTEEVKENKENEVNKCDKR